MLVFGKFSPADIGQRRLQHAVALALCQFGVIFGQFASNSKTENTGRRFTFGLCPQRTNHPPNLNPCRSIFRRGLLVLQSEIIT